METTIKNFFKKEQEQWTDYFVFKTENGITSSVGITYFKNQNVFEIAEHKDTDVTISGVPITEQEFSEAYLKAIINFNSYLHK